MAVAIGIELLTTKEVAGILKVSQGRVRQFVVEGRLKPEKKIGTNLLFNPKTVREFKAVPRDNGRPPKNEKKTRKRSCKPLRSR
jgi:excisionase family DNA binding protein